jgi:hypothetical protein
MSEGLYLSERESAILGQEFLTWLWFKSEHEGGRFKSGDEWFEVYMEQRVSVEGGSGEGKEVATVAGPHAEMREARMGLSTGKKVNRALLRLAQDGEEWTMQLKAEDFAYNSVRTPKVDTRREQGEDPDGVWLEKLYLLEKCIGFIDVLYRQFLEVRLSSLKWPQEVKAFRAWLTKR